MTCSAPSDLSKAACYSFLTIFKSGIPNDLQRLLSILPKAEAAAVCMIPFLPAVPLNISVIPTTVRGFTMPDAALTKGTSSSIGNIFSGMATAYSPHDPDPSCKKQTLFPTQSWRSCPLAD